MLIFQITLGKEAVSDSVRQDSTKTSLPKIGFTSQTQHPGFSSLLNETKLEFLEKLLAQKFPDIEQLATGPFGKLLICNLAELHREYKLGRTVQISSKKDTLLHAIKCFAVLSKITEDFELKLAELEKAAKRPAFGTEPAQLLLEKFAAAFKFAMEKNSVVYAPERNVIHALLNMPDAFGKLPKGNAHLDCDSSSILFAQLCKPHYQGIAMRLQHYTIPGSTARHANVLVIQNNVAIALVDTADLLQQPNAQPAQNSRLSVFYGNRGIFDFLNLTNIVPAFDAEPELYSSSLLLGISTSNRRSPGPTPLFMPGVLDVCSKYFAAYCNESKNAILPKWKIDSYDILIKTAWKADKTAENMEGFKLYADFLLKTDFSADLQKNLLVLYFEGRQIFGFKKLKEINGFFTKEKILELMAANPFDARSAIKEANTSDIPLPDWVPSWTKALNE